MKTIIYDFDWVIHDSFEFHRQKIKDFSWIELEVDEFRDIHNWNFFNNTNEKIKNIDWIKYRDYISSDFRKLEADIEVSKRLLELSENNIQHIVSSWWEENIKSYLSNNSIGGYFWEVLWMESHHSKIEKLEFIIKKHSLSRENCIFVTDTLWDILEANKVNIKTIAVDFWFHTTETLEKWNPFKIVSSFREIVELVKINN